MKTEFTDIIMDEESVIDALRAELDMTLNALELIRSLNSRGKTLLIDQEITAILTAYNR